MNKKVFKPFDNVGKKGKTLIMYAYINRWNEITSIIEVQQQPTGLLRKMVLRVVFYFINATPKLWTKCKIKCSQRHLLLTKLTYSGFSSRDEAAFWSGLVDFASVSIAL